MEKGVCTILTKGFCAKLLKMILSFCKVCEILVLYEN